MIDFKKDSEPWLGSSRHFQFHLLLFEVVKYIGMYSCVRKLIIIITMYIYQVNYIESMDR